MLPASRTAILDRLSDDDAVLDVGGWADPFERADWVIDLMPYETRGLYAREGWTEGREAAAERFTSDTWVERDICDREPWPFDDDRFDFAICSHTLEDVRDPVWVCSELSRVAKAGYVEVPSRLEEQSWGVHGQPFVGWEHHRWLIDVAADGIAFAFKPHGLHTHPAEFFPGGFWERLSEPERVQTLWWEGTLACSERFFADEADVREYLRDFVAGELRGRPLRGGGRDRLRLLRRRLRL